MNFATRNIRSWWIAGSLVLGATCISRQAHAEPRFVSSADALVQAVANAKPGDEIVVKAGEYKLNRTLAIKVRGTEAAPVLIRSEKPGAAVLAGTHTLALRGASWVTVEGFVFAHQLLPAKTWLSILECEQVRITRNRFAFDENGATETDHYHSVGIEKSTHVRVDHCEFGPRTTRSMGDYVSTHLGSRYLRIDHNYFKHRANIKQNGGETVMLHGAGVWSHYAVVEDNLFERCNGEGELIGLKSSRNTVRNNTFINCEGAISIRHGHYNKVYGNTILNLLPKKDLGATRTGGVRIFGTHNEVVNNYMYRLQTPLEAEWGDVDPVPLDNGTAQDAENRTLGYVASHDNLIAHNTIIESDCVFRLVKKGIEAEPAFARITKAKLGPIKDNLERYRENTSGGYITPHFAPSRWFFLNNLSVNNRSFGSTRVFNGAQPPYEEEGFVYSGNVNFAADQRFTYGAKRSFSEHEWRTVAPKLCLREEGIYEPEPESPLRNLVQPDQLLLEKWGFDLKSQAELQACKRIGVSAPVKRLTPKDVGIHSK